MASKDKELEAIGSIINLLTPLDQGERSRVLEYVLKRLQMATVHAPVGGVQEPTEPSSALRASRRLTDIRSLTAEKQPRSVNEMVARTSTSHAPWELVPANDKRWARVRVIKTVCNRLAKAV